MKITQKTLNKLHIDCLSVKKTLVDFIKVECQNAGFQKVVLGLSGGVDSSVVASLSVLALGKENVIAVLLPHKLSSPSSRKDAELLISQLGIRSETIDITPIVDAFLKEQEISHPIRLGNIMARVRMIILYDISYREKALVIGTSNKTELLLGYGTIFGDMACAINPIGDLYKTQVWQLAEALDIPKHIIEKKPTADLWPGQTDEDEMGISYKEADQLLFELIDKQRTPEEILKLGFDRNLLVKVQQRMRDNQFKLHPPRIAKISK